MDKREALRVFIKKHSDALRQDPFLAEAFKSLKRKFFLDYARASVPKDSEIAAEALEVLIDNSDIKSEEDLETILSLPFFKEKVQNKAYYHERLRLKSVHSQPLVDVRKLRETEYAKKLREDLRKEAMDEITKEKGEHLKKLDDEIEKKIDSYLSLPSILDEKEYPVPELPEEEKSEGEEAQYLPWWEKLGLNDDPFSVLEEFSKTGRELYDQIIHKTQIFHKYESMIERAPKQLFRNIVVFGQFGSGKTTFFDYLYQRLYERKIYPIYVQLGGEFEVRELEFEFRRRMINELSQLLTVLSGQASVSFDASDDEQTIVDLLKRVGYYGSNGFVIFIDDLHKGDLDKAMKFMNYLQILTSQLRRTASTLNLGFFIAGSLEWERRMANDPKYSGSVSSEEHMPPLGFEDALDALNRRLRVFAKNPENPKQLDPKFLERIFKALKRDGQDITFRSVIRAVINEFESGHFDAVSANPITIPDGTLSKLKSDLEQNLLVRRQLFSLTRGKLKPFQKRRCLELLVDVYLKNGLPDLEIREQEAPYLQQLVRSGLIIKVDRDGRLVYRISKELWYVNSQIIQEQNLSLEDYLLKVYSPEPAEITRKPRPRNEEIDYLDDLMANMAEGSLRDILKESRDLHLSIIELESRYLREHDGPTTIIGKCIKALVQLTQTYWSFEGIQTATKCDDLDILSFWKSFWWSPEIIQQFVRATLTETDDRRRAAQVVTLYREAFPQLFKFFRDEYEGSRFFHISLVDLKNDEIELLHDCRKLFRQNDLKELCSKLCKAIERKLRIFLFDIFTILYGDFEHRKMFLDKDSLLRIERNLAEGAAEGSPLSRNEFKQLNRNQYASLMSGDRGSPEGRRNWRHIFSGVFQKWSERELYDYLNLFADISGKMSVDRYGKIEPALQDLAFDFMQKSMRFMMDINRTFVRLLKNECFKYTDAARFSLCGFDDTDTSRPVILRKEDVGPLEEVFQGRDQLRIPLDDQEYIEGITGLAYRTVYALLAMVYNQTVDQLKKTRLRLDLVEAKGCELYLRLVALMSTKS